MNTQTFLLAVLCLVFASSVCAQQSSFLENISTFNSYQPYRVPPLPSITLPTIVVADTDDSAAPFALLTLSAFNNVPSFVLPPVSFFDASVFGNNADDDDNVVVFSPRDSSSASTVAVGSAALVAAVLCML